MYLRTLLIQGAKSIVLTAQKRDDPISQWALKIRPKFRDAISKVAGASLKINHSGGILAKKPYPRRSRERQQRVCTLGSWILARHFRANSARHLFGTPQSTLRVNPN
jgi:hypothetical protein